jgi:ssDNA-binding Zn-finger/Zn-ribbon topoisomerase 1
MSAIDDLTFDAFDMFDVEDDFEPPVEPKSEDVSFDDYEPRFPAARTDLRCGDCGAPMEVRPSKFGCFYGCVKWPDCNGTHGAHPDGKPKGIPANKATREARVRAHFVFDKVWKERLKSRREAYRWMRDAMGLSASQAHIGRFDRDQCDHLMALVYESFPSLHTRYSRLAWEQQTWENGK